MESLELSKVIANALNEKKATDIKLLKIRDLTVLGDYFVIASGTSTTQVKALADEVEWKLSEIGIKPLRVEGYESKSWILLDFGTVIVHIFYPEAREFYNLEHLWEQASEIQLDLD